MTVRYLDHAATVSTREGLKQHFSPGLIDVDAYPQVAPHLDGRTDWNRPAKPHFELKRCCPACERGYERSAA